MSLDFQERLKRPVHTPLRVVFCGTPEYAVPTLAALVEDPRCMVVGVLCQPDRPVGRGRRLEAPPVARWAKQHGLELLQPEQLNDVRERLQVLAPDLLVVIAYGKLLPQWLLELPRLLPLNLHASLLPRHRGAAPIQAAILAGDRETGVTLMGMVKALDAGPILLVRRIELSPQVNAGELQEQLAQLSAQTMRDGIDALLAGTLQCVPQDEAAATYAGKIHPAHAHIDWRADAEMVDRLIRAMAPRPGARTGPQQVPLKILAGRPLASPATQPPGCIEAVNADAIVVACGSGTYAVTQLQPPGGRVLQAADFARGRALKPGMLLAAT